MGGAAIINVSSAATLHTPGPLNSAYATSKIALNAMTRVLAAEVAGTGVTANLLHPGDVKTEMWQEIKDNAAALGEEGAGLREWAAWVEETGGDPPGKAADLVLQLVSDAASADKWRVPLDRGWLADANRHTLEAGISRAHLMSGRYLRSGA